MIPEWVWQAASATALALAAWAAKEVIKIPSMEENVQHIRSRVDTLYDHLITRTDR